MVPTDKQEPDARNLDVGNRVEAQGAQIREAAKWLIGSFAAVGAALIAGSQLSSIGKLPVCWATSVECSRLWVAGAGAIGALAGVMWAIWVGVRLLAPARLQVSDLKGRWKEGDPIFDYFAANTSQLQGFTDLDDMEAQEAEADRKFDELTSLARNVKGDDRTAAEDELNDVNDSLIDLRVRSDNVVTIANHVNYMDFFSHKALKGLIMGAVAAAIGIVAFSWSANPAAPPPSASMRGANLAEADLSGVDLRNVDLTGALLDGADLTGADLEGAVLDKASLTDVVWSGTTCPDGTNSDDAAGSCENHL